MAKKRFLFIVVIMSIIGYYLKYHVSKIKTDIEEYQSEISKKFTIGEDGKLKDPEIENIIKGFVSSFSKNINDAGTNLSSIPKDKLEPILDTIKTIFSENGTKIILSVADVLKSVKPDEEKTKKAKTMIINALIGVAIMLLALFLVSMVQSFMSTSGMGNIFAPNQCIGTNN